MKSKLKYLQKFPRTSLLSLLVIVMILGIISFNQLVTRIGLPFFVEKKVTVQKPDVFDFNDILEETGDMNATKSQNWWLNSGGQLSFDGMTAKTIQGELDSSNKWFGLYKNSTPVETDSGLHPQNIFRLVNKNNIQNYVQQAYFKINKSTLSRSPNRNESNGILFLNRYLDGDNLYYTGIRVDGTSIIKKKINGNYLTMAQNKVFEGAYNKESNPNLLPEDTWIGLKSEVKNLNFRTVEIKLFIDKKGDGNWEQIAEAIDDGSTYDGASFINPGHPGIRTDFMDIEFKDYSLSLL